MLRALKLLIYIYNKYNQTTLKNKMLRQNQKNTEIIIKQNDTDFDLNSDFSDPFGDNYFNKEDSTDDLSSQSK